MTSYDAGTRNTTSYDEVVAPGILTYLLTDALDYILVGANEDEVLILWESTSFSADSRNTTATSAGTRNTTEVTAGTRNTTTYSTVARN